VRRPQKPFTVEVKRAGRTPLSAPPPVKPKPRELTVDDVFKPRSAAADEVFKQRDPAPSKPTGRILDTLTPEPVVEPQPEFLELPEVEPEAPVERRMKAAAKAAPQLRRTSTSVVEAVETAALPVKARRGRPPKVIASKDLAATDLSEPVRIIAADEEPALPAVVVAAVEPALAPVDFPYLAPLRGQAAPLSERGARKAALHPGRLTHSIRAETAENLPRGERWKRRLPKVLW